MSIHIRYFGNEKKLAKYKENAISIANKTFRKSIIPNLSMATHREDITKDIYCYVLVYEKEVFVNIYDNSVGMKSGLIRNGKVIKKSTIDSDGVEHIELTSRDFLESSKTYNVKLDEWIKNGGVYSNTEKPKREYKEISDLYYISEKNKLGRVYPVPSSSTGLLHEALELAIGANRIVDIAQGFRKTHGIYRDSVNNIDWLVEIGYEKCVAIKLVKLNSSLYPTYSTDINNTKLGYVPDSLYMPAGEEFNRLKNSNDIIVFDNWHKVQWLYRWNANNFDNTGLTGWAFDDNGHNCTNVFIYDNLSVPGGNGNYYSSVCDVSISIQKNDDGKYVGNLSVSQTPLKDIRTDAIQGPLYYHNGIGDNNPLNYDPDNDAISDSDMNLGHGLRWGNGTFGASSSGPKYYFNTGTYGDYSFPVWSGYMNNVKEVVEFGYKKEPDVTNIPTWENGVFKVGDIEWPAYVNWGNPRIYPKQMTGTQKTGGMFYYIKTSDGTHLDKVSYDIEYDQEYGVESHGSFITDQFWDELLVNGGTSFDTTYRNEGCCYIDVVSGNGGVGFLPTTDFITGSKSTSKNYTLYKGFRGSIFFSTSWTDRSAYHVRKLSYKKTNISSDSYITRKFASYLNDGPVYKRGYLSNDHNGNYVDGFYYVYDSPLIIGYFDPIKLLNCPGGTKVYNNYVLTSDTITLDGNLPTHDQFGQPGDIKIFNFIAGNTTETSFTQQNIFKINGVVYNRNSYLGNEARWCWYNGAFGKFYTIDGMGFMSYRCATNGSKLAFTYNSNNNGNGDPIIPNTFNQIFYIEEKMDDEQFITWNLPDYKDNFINHGFPDYKYYMPYTQYGNFNERQVLNEIASHQFFGPYVWIGVNKK